MKVKSRRNKIRVNNLATAALTAILVCLTFPAVFLNKTDVYAANPGTTPKGGTTDDDHVTYGNCKNPTNGTLCFDSSNPEYSGWTWVYVPFEAGTDYDSLGIFYSSGSFASGSNTSAQLAQCQEAGAEGYYIHGTFWYQWTKDSSGNLVRSRWEPPKLKGPLLWSNAISVGAITKDDSNKYASSLDYANAITNASQQSTIPAEWPGGIHTVSVGEVIENYDVGWNETPGNMGGGWDQGGFSTVCKWTSTKKAAQSNTHAWIEESNSLADAKWVDGQTDDKARHTVNLGKIKTSDCWKESSSNTVTSKTVNVSLASYLKSDDLKSGDSLDVEYKIVRTVTGISSANIPGWEAATATQTAHLTGNEGPDGLQVSKKNYSVTIPASTNPGDIEICEYIYYKKNNTDTSLDGTTHACATITVTVEREYVPPCEEDPGFCSEINGLDLDGGVNYGNTAADVYVLNSSSTSTMRSYIMTGTARETVMDTVSINHNRLDSKGYLDNWVFAKPGDSIKFRYRLCSTAMNVSGGTLYENYDQRDGYGDNGVGRWSGSGNAKGFGYTTHGIVDNGGGEDVYGGNGYSAVNYKFSVTAEPNKSYVFKNTASVFASDTAYPLKINVNGGPNSGAEYTPNSPQSPVYFLPSKDRNNIGFRFYSPSADAISTYRCSPFYTLSRDGYSFTTYQIPGFSSWPSGVSVCNAASQTDGDTNKVGIGETIAQKISWNNIVGFEQLRGTDSTGGYCENKPSGVAECPERDYRHSLWNVSWDRWSPGVGSSACVKDSDNLQCHYRSTTHDDPHAYRTATDGYRAYDKVKSAGGAWYWKKTSCPVTTCYYKTCCCEYEPYTCWICTSYTSSTCTDSEGHSYDCSYCSGGYWGTCYRCKRWGQCCPMPYNYRTDPTYRTLFWYDYSKEKPGKDYEQDEARVYTPFNFSTDKYIQISNEPVLFGGSSVTSSWNYWIKKKNNIFTSTFDYATITPSSSKVQVVEFTLSPDENSAPTGGKNVNLGSGGLCNYFGRNCTVIDETSGPFNPEGDYEGWESSGSKTRTVPDYEAGTKYCVAIGIYPADSTNWEPITVSNGISLLKGANGDGIAMKGGSTWNISDAVCRTIAKKPSFQVWNGGIFTPAGVTASVSQKIAGTGLAAPYASHNQSAETTFGSWDETLIVANGTVKGIASGAGLGYNGESGTSGGKNYGFALKGGVENGVHHANVSSLTISNVSGTIGNSGIGSISTTILSRLVARYANLSDTTNMNLNGEGMQYIRAPGDSRISDIVRDALGGSYSYGSTVYNGNIIKGSISANTDGPHKGEYGDNTLVIQVDGTLMIDRDICYGSCSSAPSTWQFSGGSGWVSGGSTVLNNYGLMVSSISALPQIIIFADDIIIGSSVTRIDAWLIASEGYIDTCSDGPVNSRTCTQPLVVNGPVFTRSLYLGRTSGSWPGGQMARESGGVLNQNLSNDGSISPAEIFNLRSDVYLWAYNQAQRYTEAVVTYTRELAPRY